MRHAALFALAVVALGGCHRSLRTGANAEPASVESFALSFDSDAHGTLTFELAVDNPGKAEGLATVVSWELWLAGRLFASGTQDLRAELPATQPQRVSVTAPFVFRRRTFVDVPKTLEVGVRGTVVLTSAGQMQTLTFEKREPQRLPRSPALDVDED